MTKLYTLDGERQFHDEAAVWQATLEGLTQAITEGADQDSPEWVSWMNASVDLQVDPTEVYVPAKSVPKFGLQQAQLMPRFRGMTKVALVDWLNSNGHPSIKASDMNKNDLIDLAKSTVVGRQLAGRSAVSR